MYIGRQPGVKSGWLTRMRKHPCDLIDATSNGTISKCLLETRVSAQARWLALCGRPPMRCMSSTCRVETPLARDCKPWLVIEDGCRELSPAAFRRRMLNSLL